MIERSEVVERVPTPQPNSEGTKYPELVPPLLYAPAVSQPLPPSSPRMVAPLRVLPHRSSTPQNARMASVETGESETVENEVVENVTVGYPPAEAEVTTNFSSSAAEVSAAEAATSEPEVIELYTGWRAVKAAPKTEEPRSNDPPAEPVRAPRVTQLPTTRFYVSPQFTSARPVSMSGWTSAPVAGR